MRSSRTCERFHRSGTRCRAPARTPLPAYLWGKFRMLILGEDIPSYFYGGNAGIAGGAQ